MGFLNKILKGLGFEDEETLEINKEPKEVIKKDKKKKTPINASYDLNKVSENGLDDNKLNQQISNKESCDVEESSLDLVVVKVKSQEDIQNAIQKIKAGAKIIVNIEALSSEDITRSLDFLTGAFLH